MSLTAQTPQPNLAWAFDGTTTDYVKGVSGSIGGVISYETGKYGNSLNIKNPSGTTSNSVNFNFSASYSIDLGFSECFWFKCNDLSYLTSIQIVSITYSGFNNAFRFQINTSGSLQFQFQDSVGNININMFGPTIGAWYHLAAVAFNGIVTIYVNGAYYAQTAYVQSGITFDNMSLGLATNFSGYPLTNGSYDDLRIFDQSLTSLQVQAVYAAQGMPGRGALVTSGVTGGDTVQNIGGYRIHTFTTTGTQTFTVSGASITGAQMLVVAGGGGGGFGTGGGGGAGGLVYVSSTTLSAGSYTVTVGAGGAGNTTGQGVATNGGNSSVTGYTTAIGGGGGANTANASAGGSGGGTTNNVSGFGAGTAGQGNRGGTGLNSGAYESGGGGGAGAVGANGVVGTPGAGGIGLAYSISGTSKYYAGGGGGGWNGSATGASGGLGGGGNGGNAANNTAGTPNTGGGGGGGNNFGGSVAGKSGGSGIVIIAYPTATSTMSGTPLFSQLSTEAAASSVGAFSLRAVNGTSARAVQVRRSSDSATLDFYADRLGNLLTAPCAGQSLAKWLGGATGYVATWYDQSSAGNHATQTTAANQPIIQRATKGPGYMVNFNGTSQFVTLSASYNFLNGTNTTVNAVALRTATVSGPNYIIGTNSPTVSYQRFFLGYASDTSVAMPVTGAPTVITIPAYNASNEPVTYMTGALTPSRVLYKNDTLGGTNADTALLSVPSGYSYSIGYTEGAATYYYRGNLFELLIFTSAFNQTQVTQVYNNQFSMYGGIVLNVTSGTSTATLSPGTYTFTLAGGVGGTGGSGTQAGGSGMILNAVFTLSASTSIKYVVGGSGGNFGGSGGGGGGSYVYDLTNSRALFVAGGGGGAGSNSPGNNATGSASPGTGAGGAVSSASGGGGGGGLFGNGTDAGAGGGKSFLVSASPVGSGTSAGGTYGNPAANGGFGGGGAGGAGNSGGGGGGYTGGNQLGVSVGSNGGTSYAIAGSSGLTESITNTSSGYITVSN